MSPKDEAKKKQSSTLESQLWESGAEALHLALGNALHEALDQAEQSVKNAANDVLEGLKQDSGKILEKAIEASTDNGELGLAQEGMREAEAEVDRLKKSIELRKRETLRTLEENKASREAQTATLGAREAELAESLEVLATKGDELDEARRRLEHRSVELAEGKTEIEHAREELAKREEELESLRGELKSRSSELEDAISSLAEQASELTALRNLQQAGPLELKGEKIKRALDEMEDAAVGLRKTFLDTEQEEFVGKLGGAGSWLARALRTMITLDQLEGGGIKPATDLFSPSALLEYLWDLHSERARAKGLTLELNLDGECPEMVIGDPDQLGLILANLLDNAIKFTNNGSIQMSLACDESPESDTLLKFAVTDKGRGMQSDEVERINSGEIPSGEGLGLALAHRLLAHMESSLKIESQLGMGSRCSFTVALESVEPAAV